MAKKWRCWTMADHVGPLSEICVSQPLVWREDLKSRKYFRTQGYERGQQLGRLGHPEGRDLNIVARIKYA
jgi:hypothetical protein